MTWTGIQCSIVYLLIMRFSRCGNQSLTIVLPGNAQRLTPCDNPLKSNITSFTDGTVPEWLFKARCFHILNLCLSGIFTKKKDNAFCYHSPNQSRASYQTPNHWLMLLVCVCVYLWVSDGKENVFQDRYLQLCGLETEFMSWRTKFYGVFTKMCLNWSWNGGDCQWMEDCHQTVYVSVYLGMRDGGYLYSLQSTAF